MAKPPTSGGSHSNAQQIQSLRIVANQTLANTGVNPYQTANTLMLQQQKKQLLQAHYDKLGQTCPNQAVSLAMDAARPANHSRILARNLNRNTGQTRPQYVAAHHIVARLAADARIARMCLYGWGIAINDADNGVYLPRYLSSNVPSLPLATAHSTIHTTIYYLAVNERLDRIQHLPTLVGRKELRKIRQEIISGIFPY
ncbi:AHH domain-containing protein [Massilia sp. W12]|uniref:AHH domain-containing protein n=1 Tax=Massilia sp. W12 TaxID=3126507 RepID=UPI0030D3D038